MVRIRLLQDLQTDPTMSANPVQTTDSIAPVGVDGYVFSGDNYTVERKCAFIGLYREHGSIFHAAQLTPVSRKTVYNWIDADPQFAEAVADSKENSLDELESSVFKRAFTDNLLAMFYLKAHRPKFRDKVQIDVDVVRDEIQQRIQQLGVQRLPATTTEFINAQVQQPQAEESLQFPPQPENQQKEGE